jgi:hypothetical protein
LFRHTIRQRSQGSIRAFADGLFGPNGFQSVVFENIPEQDTFLRVRFFEAFWFPDLICLVSQTNFAQLLNVSAAPLNQTHSSTDLNLEKLSPKSTQNLDSMDQTN